MMRSRQGNGLTGVRLNFLAATFSKSEVEGFPLDYKGADELRLLQDEYEGRFLIRRGGQVIKAVPLDPDATLPPGVGEPCTFSAKNDWTLFSILLEEGVRRVIRTRNPRMIVPKYGRLWVKARGEENDLIKIALRAQREELAKLDFIHIYRQYHIVGTHLKADVRAPHRFGILLKINTNWRFTANIMELIRKGVDVTGCYVVPANDQGPNKETIGDKIVGRIRSVNGSQVKLVDFRDQDTVDVEQYTIEASLDNVARCIYTLCGNKSQNILRLIKREVSNLMSAEGQLRRISEVARALSREAIDCADGLTAILSNDAFPTYENQHEVIWMEPPRYIIRYGREPIKGPISAAINSEGPLDQDSFKKTTPYVLFITPNRTLGTVEQYF